ATVSDGESSNGQLIFQWQTLLHHNDHDHGGPPDTNQTTTAVLSPTGCDGINLYYTRIRLTVTDPTGLATVREVTLFPDCGPNPPPTISLIANQTVSQSRATLPLAFTIGDSGISPANLQLAGSSSDPVLVPANNIVFGGAGANRTVTVMPAEGQLGNATITVSVSDGPNQTSTSFNLNVLASAPASLPGFVTEAHSATDGSGAAFNGSTLTLPVSGADTLIIAAWHSEFDGGAPNGWRVEDQGRPGTLLVDTNGYTGGDGNRRFRIYYWANPPPGPNRILVTNDLTVDPNELAVSAILLTNVLRTAPIGAVGIDVSTTTRSAESETVPATNSDLVVHVIADALFVQGTLGSGETSRSVANDGLHTADGDASLWISTKPANTPTTTVSSSGWAKRVLNGVAIVVHGNSSTAPGISA
ncbi:MAG TPA: hypothetical protein VNM37_05860, partial [Candidatus Dormibacteraeota bacterium]|nr:hypothetical protein [Candidatus Dormibacteraeota bacterium]